VKTSKAKRTRPALTKPGVPVALAMPRVLTAEAQGERVERIARGQGVSTASTHAEGISRCRTKSPSSPVARDCEEVMAAIRRSSTVHNGQGHHHSASSDRRHGSQSAGRGPVIQSATTMRTSIRKGNAREVTFRPIVLVVVLLASQRLCVGEARNDLLPAVRRSCGRLPGRPAVQDPVVPEGLMRSPIDLGRCPARALLHAREEERQRRLLVQWRIADNAAYYRATRVSRRRLSSA